MWARDAQAGCLNVCRPASRWLACRLCWKKGHPPVYPAVLWGHHSAPLPRGQLQQPPKQTGPRELAEATLTLYTHVYSQGQMVKYWIRFNATPV